MKPLKLKHTVKDMLKCTNLLILAHKDLDGAISAALLFHKLHNKYDCIHTVFASHGNLQDIVNKLVGLGSIGNYSDIALVDLGLRTDAMFSFNKFLSCVGDKLKYIFDHHVGWELVVNKMKNTKLEKFNLYTDSTERPTDSTKILRVVTKASSCGQIIRDFYNMEDPYLNDLAEISMISDDLTYKTTDERILKAYRKLKFTLIPLALKQMIQENDVDNFDDPDTRTYKFFKLSRQDELVNDVFDSIVEISPGIGYISEIKSRNIDVSSLCTRAYEKYRVLIIKELNVKDCGAYFIVGHNMKGLDLTKVFNLRAGSPRKVTLYKSKYLNVSSVVAKLSKYVG